MIVAEKQGERRSTHSQCRLEFLSATHTPLFLQSVVPMSNPVQVDN